MSQKLKQKIDVKTEIRIPVYSEIRDLNLYTTTTATWAPVMIPVQSSSCLILGEEDQVESLHFERNQIFFGFFVAQAFVSKDDAKVRPGGMAQLVEALKNPIFAEQTCQVQLK